MQDQVCRERSSCLSFWYAAQILIGAGLDAGHRRGAARSDFRTVELLPYLHILHEVQDGAAWQCSSCAPHRSR